MTSDSDQPNPEIMRHGKALLSMDATMHGDQQRQLIDAWVTGLAELVPEAAGQIDWYFAGGTTILLHHGSKEIRAKVEAAIDRILSGLVKHYSPPGSIMRRYQLGDPQPFRGGVTQLPRGAEDAIGGSV